MFEKANDHKSQMAGHTTNNSKGLRGQGSGCGSKGPKRRRSRGSQGVGPSVGEKQRMKLATRPLIQALGDLSRTAFTTNSLQAPLRSQDLHKRWAAAFTEPRDSSIRHMFFYIFARNRPEFGADDRWYPVRPLGHGSFGAAGLFKHEDAAGRVDDVSYCLISILEILIHGSTWSLSMPWPRRQR
jgi:hypothetical protein